MTGLVGADFESAGRVWHTERVANASRTEPRAPDTSGVVGIRRS
jgi:hypothetical protein